VVSCLRVQSKIACSMKKPVERRWALISIRLLPLGGVELRVDDQRENEKVITDPKVRRLHAGSLENQGILKSTTTNRNRDKVMTRIRRRLIIKILQQLYHMICSDDDVVILVCATGECNHIIDSDAGWVVNSKTLYHYIPKREYFNTYKDGNFGSINMGNNSVVDIVGVCDICI